MRRSLPISPLLLAYAALACVVLAPVCLVGTPVLGDYLNHLARMHVLSALSHSADLRRFYVIDWTPIPYLAMDFIVPLLALVFPIYTAGKLFVAACVLMPVAASATLHYVLHRRVSWVPLAAFLFSYNTLLSLGFLNYLFSCGCAIMLFAGWIATAGWRWWLRVVVFAPLILLLYFGHAFACLAYCLSVAGYEIGRAARARFQPFGRIAADFVTAGLPALPAVAFAATLDVSAGYIGPLHTIFGSAGVKLFALASPVLFSADQIQLLVMAAAIVLCVMLLPRLLLAPAVWPSALLVGLAALAMPHMLASTWGTDLRLPLVCVLLLIGAAGFKPLPEGAQKRAAVLAVAVLTLIKSADSWSILHRHDVQLAETRKVLQAFPHGARLLVVTAARTLPGHYTESPFDVWHMPLIAVIEHDAFVPYFFNGLSSVHIRPQYRESSTPNGLPITPDQLRDGMSRHDEPGKDVPDGINGSSGRLYHYDWPHKFDYVLLQRYGFDPGPLPGILVPIAGTPDLTLYRIDRHAG